MRKNMMIAIAAAMLTAGSTACKAQTQQETTVQQQTEQQEPVYEQNEVEQKAEFVGGMGKQINFLLQNLRYPKEAEDEGASGTVRVHFIVEKDGSLTDVKVPESVHPALDAEGIRVVKAMPKWTPAQLNGKAVRSKMMLAMPFRLK
ncbi:MAG: energy transducer TonB [Bacteroidaceae bacterium]|nr:energy transducer TonB [Bacteroidaceae bacterium]